MFDRFKIYLSWKQVNDLYNNLLHNIKMLNIKADVICSPLYGGIWIAQKLSEDLNIPIEFLDKSLKTKNKEKELIFADDIFDTGKTLFKFLEKNNLSDSTVMSCFLLSKENKYKLLAGDKYHLTNYVVFPWEDDFNELFLTTNKDEEITKLIRELKGDLKK
jgi:hypoxanthine phosphoribosyltransferase